MMQEMIWMDAAAYMGRGTKWLDEDEQEPIYNTTEVHLGPENKKECPCDTCPMMQQCLDNGTECSAMRNWCATGDYWDTDGWDTKIQINKKTKEKKTVKYWRKSDLMRLVRAMA